MVVNFEFTRQDYLNAFRAHYRKGASLLMRWTLRLSLVVGATFLLFGLLFVLTGQHALNLLLPQFIFGAVWFWIGMGGSYRLSAGAQFSKSPAARGLRRVEFTDEGMKTDVGVASSNLTWKGCTRYIESKDTFLIYTSPACFMILPKRALQSEQVNELRELLKRHISKQSAVAVA